MDCDAIDFFTSSHTNCLPLPPSLVPQFFFFAQVRPLRTFFPLYLRRFSPFHLSILHTGDNFDTLIGTYRKLRHLPLLLFLPHL